MRLDAASESRFLEYSRRLGMTFGAVVQGYIIEGALQQISNSSFGECLWLGEQRCLGIEAYERNRSGRLEYYYIESEREISREKLIPGQRLSIELLSIMSESFFFEKNRWHIRWITETCRVHEREAYMQVIGQIDGLEVPLELRFHGITGRSMAPKHCKITSFVEEKREIGFLAYPTENMVAEQLIEIITKLELISDMEPYAYASDILREQSISGRYVISILEDYAEREPSFRKAKRIEQLKSYRNYSYMRKRWDKYQKHQQREQEKWTDVLERILNFTEPVWHAFMKNEIFLDDWMPELGRFLE